MLKIATVLMTTTVFAGLLISGPGALTKASAERLGAVKVKTIAIHRTAAPRPVAAPVEDADLLDPNPLTEPAVLAGTQDGLHSA